jgi:glycosyltransferase involved in cell wall biosynthesis
MLDPIKVSVIMITYNQDIYLKNAIDGVLMQECNFPVELIIADDCSRDNTFDVVESFSNHRRFNWIKYTKHSFNKGANRNFIWAVNKSKGQFIALCEGDDYWTDPCKLQKQVSLIDKDVNCNIVYHNCITISNDSNNEKLIYNLSYNKDLYIMDLLNGDFAKTCTLLFRKSGLVLFPDELDDTLLGMLLLENGCKATYIPEVMAAYRIHSFGVWSLKKTKQRIRDDKKKNEFLINRYKNKFPEIVKARVKMGYHTSSLNLMNEREFLLALKNFTMYSIMERSLNLLFKNLFKFIYYFTKSLLINK